MAKKSVCRTHDCSVCCTVGTDVPLTNKDIERIKELGYKEEFFVEEVKGWKLLKLEENTCVFLRGGICSIHKHRPESCRLYPAVFEINTNEVVVDSECVYADEFRITKKDIDGLHALSDLLDKERAERLAAKGLTVEQVDKLVDENGFIDEIEEEDEPETVDEDKEEDKKNDEKDKQKDDEKKEEVKPLVN
ncbi:MAG: YkgJ family cysteine cluster protein [Thermoplasmata archaeon]